MNDNKFNFIKKQIMNFNNDEKKLIKLDFQNNLINYEDSSDNWLDTLNSYIKDNDFKLSIVIDYENKEIKNNKTYLNSILLIKSNYDKKFATIEEAFENINYNAVIKF